MLKAVVECPHCDRYINGNFDTERDGQQIKYCPHCKEAYGFKIKTEVYTYRPEDY